MVIEMNNKRTLWWIVSIVGIVLLFWGICDIVRGGTVGKDILTLFPDSESIRALVNDCFLKGIVKTAMGVFLVFFSLHKNRNTK